MATNPWWPLTTIFLLSVIGSPEIWQETMSVLQDQCPKEDFSTIKSIIEKQLDFDNVFASFEEEPIGAASIGQGKLELFTKRNNYIALCLMPNLVHRATLKDGTR
jgi:ABC1 atypical kinase-like domain